MDLIKRLSFKNIFYAVIILLYIIINLAFLDSFPFVHSDECWLGGLSRNIAETGNYRSTEAFFDLKPRYPHAIKIIFHTMQIVIIKAAGYSITNLRLLSFVFGLFALLFFFQLVKMESKSENLALLTTALLALDIQFIYASHFARQEIILVFVLVFTMYYFFRHLDNFETKHSIISGIFIGLSIGIHPNSFIISLPFAALYLYFGLTKKLKFRHLFFYISTLAAFAAAFVLLSFQLDPNFITDYSKYGNEFEVFNPITSKVAEVSYFYKKLYYMVSGTYYTPNIKLQFLLFPLFIAVSSGLWFSSRKSWRDDRIIPIIISILALNAGIILIGRYNQTSVVFQFPLFYLLASIILVRIRCTYRWTAAWLLLALISGNTVLNVLPHTGNDYAGYLNEISRAVNKDDTVLANLNSDFYFDNGRLHDYRNLAYLKENNMNFEDYIKQNGIKYIILPEELELIYEKRPKWDGIYGPLLYYNEMKNFLKYKCEPVHEFSNKTYGIRISQYINTRDWKVSIYRVIGQ